MWGGRASTKQAQWTKCGVRFNTIVGQCLVGNIYISKKLLYPNKDYHFKYLSCITLLKKKKSDVMLTISPFNPPKCPKLQSFSMNKVNEKKKNSPWPASLWRKRLNLALTKLPMREKGDLEYSTKLSQEENDLEVSNSLSIRSTFLGEKDFLRENEIKWQSQPSCLSGREREDLRYSTKLLWREGIWWSQPSKLPQGTSSLRREGFHSPN